jgi:hypothetical protein
MTEMIAASPAARKLGCHGCHDDWNRHPFAPRDTKPLRCPGCPVLAAMRSNDLRRVSAYGRPGADEPLH